MKTTGNKFDDMSLDENQRQGGLLSSWSKRKQAVFREQEALNKESKKTDIDESVEPALLTDEDMPPIESLTADSDYTGFMSPKVSETLRRLALRKLFHGAEFNICDGLDDYDGDYTSFAKLGDIVTADMKHQIEMQARKKARLLEEQEAQKSLEQNNLEQTNLEQSNQDQEASAPEELTQEGLAEEDLAQEGLTQEISPELSANTQVARDESMQQQDKNDVDVELVAQETGNAPGNAHGIQGVHEPVDELSTQMKSPAIAAESVKVLAVETVKKGINNELEEDEDDLDGGLPG